MAAIWAKITAFFMAIAMFFSGLFELDSKPNDPTTEPTTIEQTTQVTTTQEPTTETTTTQVTTTETTTEVPTTKEEPSETEKAEIRYGVPTPDMEQSAAVCESSGGTVIARYENASSDDFIDYINLLSRSGYVIYDKNEIEGNLFASFYQNDIAVYTSWFTRTGTMRVIAEPKGEMAPLTDTCEEKYDTLLTGMKGETSVADEGMGYIIRLADGRFIIIDGGMGDPDHVDSHKLMGILNAQKPEEFEKPVIAAWIFTHLHGDHVGVFNCFSLDHHDDVIIERMYYNFPKEEEIAVSDSPYMLDNTIYRYTQFKKNMQDFYADVPVVKLHSGMRFVIGNASFEVLYAYDDYYPKTILNGGMNESSTLFKMTVDGQTTLWTGDLSFGATDLVMSEYNTALQADILQMAHHGWNGTVAFYSAVNPTIVSLPISFYHNLDALFGIQANAWLRDSSKVQQIIITNFGTWTVRLPYEPTACTFERIPSYGTVYPSYPQLLG